MFTVEATTDIRRPIEEVFDYLVDYRNSPAWASEARQAEKTSPGPVGLGTTFALQARVLGRSLTSHAQIVDYEPPYRFEIQHEAGPVNAEEDIVLLEPTAEGTRVTHRARLETNGIFRFADGIVARLVKKQWEANFALLKEILEQGHQPAR